MKRIACLLAVGCWLGAPSAAIGQLLPPDESRPQETPAAQPPPVDPPVEPPAGAGEQAPILDPTAPAETDVTLDWRTQVRAGLGFSGPLGGIGSLQILHGLGADIRSDGTRVKAVCAIPMPYCAQGFLLRADAGSGGGKLSLGVGGWAKVDDEGFKGTAGVALRVALAHTWGHPIGQPTGLTLLGPELDLSIMRIDLTLGVLFKVGGNGGSSALFSWGVGFGL